MTNSKFMRTAIAGHFNIAGDRIYVLPQLCDVEGAPTPAPLNSIGFVHRGAQKGLAFVLQLARRSPELHYLVYGHQNGFPSNPPTNVSFCGWASDRSKMFASAAVWLVPSVWAEPFGRVSIEAQAANRAVVVAANGGLPETVFDPRFRIDRFNVDSWLDRIRMLLGLSQEVLAENGAAVRQAFSVEIHDKRIADVMGQIIKS